MKTRKKKIQIHLSERGQEILAIVRVRVGGSPGAAIEHALNYIVLTDPTYKGIDVGGTLRQAPPLSAEPLAGVQRKKRPLRAV